MKNHNTLSSAGIRRQQRGFAIVEALVAFLIVAFGMMAIAAFQFTLSRSSDVAKQRTEATRIAQREIDRLRSFRQRGADGTPGDANLSFAENLAASSTFPVAFSDVTDVTSNTTYQMQSVISAPPAPVPLDGETYRWLNVVVRWTDRAGAPQQVSLSTTISDGVPSNLGGLTTGRGVAGTLRPRNRNINIPYPAVNLAGGLTSAFTVPPNNVVFIFNNETGNVIGRCVVTPPVEGDTLTPSSTGCSSADAYLLSGYVRFKTAGAAADRDNIDNPTSDLTDPSQPLLPTVLNAVSPAVNTQPFSISSGATGNAPTGVECYSQEQATLRNNSGFEVTVAIDPATGSVYSASDPDPTRAALAPPAGYSFTGNPPRFVAYTCIVTPPTGSTPRIWSGELTLNAQTAGSRGWTIGTSNSEFKVCRFSSDYNRNGRPSNGEHPRYYREVDGALDNQNFLVLRGGNSHPCPPDIAADPANGNYQDTNAAFHQPSASAELSFRCNALTNGGPGSNNCTGSTAGVPNKVVLEPASPTTFIPME